MGKTKIDICKKCWGAGRVNGGDENSTWSKTCEDCHGIGFVRVPMTNADRIRAMTDEELAKECVRQFPMYLWPNGIRAIYFDMENHKKDKAIKAWMQWLQQPAEGD